MRRILFLILPLLLLAGQALGYELLLVQSQRGPVFDEAVSGFRSSCGASSRLLVLTDYAEVDLARLVREDRPRLVVALGDRALTAARKLRQVPVVAMLAYGLNGGTSRANLTGVEMFAPPERYMPIFTALQAQRVGVVYSQEKTGWYVRRAQAAAQRVGVELVLREVKDARAVMGQLLALKGKVDALWLVPDTIAASKEIVDFYFQFAQEELLPLVSFSTNHLGLGALAVVEVSKEEIGRQAGEIATSLLSGRDRNTPPAAPRAASIKSNPAVMKRLGLMGDTMDRLFSQFQP